MMSKLNGLALYKILTQICVHHDVNKTHMSILLYRGRHYYMQGKSNARKINSESFIIKMND